MSPSGTSFAVGSVGFSIKEEASTLKGKVTNVQLWVYLYWYFLY